MGDRVLFETRNSPKNSERKWECDSTMPLKEQVNMESRNLQWFKEAMNKKMERLRTSLSYEKEILNKEKENQWVADVKLKPQLRQLTEAYDRMDSQYDQELRKMEKERKQIYWKEFERVMEGQRQKDDSRKQRTMRKRELMKDLMNIENEKRLLQNEYQEMQKKYLNKSLHMQTKSQEKFKRQKKQSELISQVKGMEEVNKRKSQKLESELQLWNDRILGTKRMIKPRAHDLFNYK